MKFSTLTNPCLPDVKLILTPDEAKVLTAIVGKISGHNEEDSPRKFISELYRHLVDGGYKDRDGKGTWKGRKYRFSHGMRIEKDD